MVLAKGHNAMQSKTANCIHVGPLCVSGSATHGQVAFLCFRINATRSSSFQDTSIPNSGTRLLTLSTHATLQVTPPLAIVLFDSFDSRVQVVQVFHFQWIRFMFLLTQTAAHHQRDTVVTSLSCQCLVPSQGKAARSLARGSV